mgnify:CR=1 FL=1
MYKHFKRAAFAAFVLACVYFAGDADLEQAKQAEASYIERVCLGVHSDYKARGVKCQN